ncbi:MAG: ABC transporter permease, partial [Clostridia bacterium]|nr:ABC transporter permease [Clostridia bacterium]
MKILSRTYMWVVFALLYAPILVLVIFSFNDAGSLSNYTGFTFRWYGELFSDAVALQALKNSLFLALSSAALSTLIGTFAALGLDRMRNRYVKGAITSVTNVPMMNPDIVTGVSMMLLFVALGGVLQLEDILGKWTMLIAHTTFSLPYVILSVLPRFR